MALTWGFFLVCLLAVIAAAVVFWLIEVKLFPEDPIKRKWGRAIWAGICIIILIVFIVNITGGNLNLNTRIGR